MIEDLAEHGDAVPGGGGVDGEGRLEAEAGGVGHGEQAALDAGDTAALLAYEHLGPHGLRAVPFPDHYFPLLYALGTAQEGERAQHVFEGFQSGTLSMRCVQWG